MLEHAITALEADRAAAADRIEKIDAALQTIRGLAGIPEAPAPAQPGKRSGRVKQATKAVQSVAPHPHQVDSLDARITHALSTGPRAPRDLATALGVEMHLLTYRLKRLATAGTVKASGATSKRRWSLSGKSAEKEAPSRRASSSTH